VHVLCHQGYGSRAFPDRFRMLPARPKLDSTAIEQEVVVPLRGPLRLQDSRESGKWQPSGKLLFKICRN
jgi:hypothetical protein